MVFLNEIGYSIFLILHIISVVAGLGAVTITDYLHLTGIRHRNLEMRLIPIYPLLGKFIIYSLFFIVLTGTILVFNKPSLINSPLFQLKIFLFFIIIINGVVLHKKVAKALDRCIIDNTTKHCTNEVFFISALCGSISIVTWYSILILSLTKTYGYSVLNFISFYIPAILIIFVIAFYNEKYRLSKHQRKMAMFEKRKKQK